MDDWKTIQAKNMQKNQKTEMQISSLDFTGNAYEQFYSVIEDPKFTDRDLYVIYDSLRNNIQSVDFSGYLKRYIYEKESIEDDFESVPIATFQQIICNCFSERRTPCSFTPTTMRIKNLAKKWLTQKTASRNTVLLLGFGLGLSVNEVNGFLTKALKEQRLNAKDPFEVICWYCYTYGLDYQHFEQLWNGYLKSDKELHAGLVSLDSTMVFKEKMMTITNEQQLFEYLEGLQLYPGSMRQSVMARIQFDILYNEICEWIAEFLTETESDRARIRTERIRERLERDDRLYDFQKNEILDRAAKQTHYYKSAEIGPAEIEQVAYASIQKDKNGNLLPLKLSALNQAFSGARLSRQHLSEILSGKAQISRYDLITMSFWSFCIDLKTKNYVNKSKRYAAFVEFADRVLEKSDMGPIYPVNPYESFLLMCIVSEDPIGTFSDVWELSYAGDED